jgi:hypothetical protein
MERELREAWGPLLKQAGFGTVYADFQTSPTTVYLWAEAFNYGDYENVVKTFAQAGKRIMNVRRRIGGLQTEQFRTRKNFPMFVAPRANDPTVSVVFCGIVFEGDAKSFEAEILPYVDRIQQMPKRLK